MVCEFLEHGRVRVPARIATQNRDAGARMKRGAAKSVRRRFLVALGRAIHLAWPVLSIILAMQVALGLLVGFVEGWPVGDSLYFTFITGLTIGYGDLVPRQARSRAYLRS